MFEYGLFVGYRRGHVAVEADEIVSSLPCIGEQGLQIAVMLVHVVDNGECDALLARVKGRYSEWLPFVYVAAAPFGVSDMAAVVGNYAAVHDAVAVCGCRCKALDADLVQPARVPASEYRIVMAWGVRRHRSAYCRPGRSPPMPRHRCRLSRLR